jgi:hypothetical protein
VGDAFTLKFPLQAVRESWRRPLFVTALGIALAIFVLLVMNPAPPTVSAHEGDEVASPTEIIEYETTELGTTEVMNGLEEAHEESEEGEAHEEVGHVEPESPFSWLAELYLIVISGIISGGYMIWQGIRGAAAWVRVKSVGSGLGLAGCCIAIERSVILFGLGVTGAAPLFAEIVGALAPLVVILAILYGRKLQRQVAVVE